MLEGKNNLKNLPFSLYSKALKTSANGKSEVFKILQY